MVFTSLIFHKYVMRWIAILFSLLPLFNIYAQVKYPIVGTYKGKTAQGMAIWEDEAYLFNDGGHCRVLSLQTGRVVKEFDIASASKKTHVNAACIVKNTDSNSGCPLMYISEFNLPSRCFVECLTDSASNLVQTICAQEDAKDVWVQSWIVDGVNSHLYSIARMPLKKNEKNTTKVKIVKYRLPLLSEGDNVVMTEKDRIDSFVVDFASGTQGGKIKGKNMYIVSGLQQSANGQFNAKRAIQVIDLKKKRRVREVDLTYVTTNEPEDIDFYHNKCLLYCGQEGGIYQIKL